MAAEFKQCPNGHYYQGDSCPYCKSGNNAGQYNTSLKTEMYANQSPNGGGATSARTVAFDDSNDHNNAETILTGSPQASSSKGYTNRTVFGDETETYTPNGTKVDSIVYRNTRKLVGWLVTYSHDAMGCDYKIFEGRNNIGRDMDCNITINDQMMSGKHAVLLFRVVNGKNRYSLKDNQSSHGTFINGEDIELDARYLEDGDIITMGETKLMFRTALFDVEK